MTVTFSFDLSPSKTVPLSKNTWLGDGSVFLILEEEPIESSPSRVIAGTGPGWVLLTDVECALVTELATAPLPLFGIDLFGALRFLDDI